MKNIGIYIHIPFCKTKCPYCDFYSVNYTEQYADIYLKALDRELEKWSRTLEGYIDTLYLGGGTPSILGTDKIISLINSIKNNFKCNNPEITLEINPSEHSILDFQLLKEIGVNRLSIGGQSAINNELRLLGRRHSSKDTVESIYKAKLAGINNISVDVMIAIPQQTKSSLKHSIEEFINNGVTHISSYLLKIEENTPYFFKSHLLDLPGEDKEAELYLYSCKTIEDYGFKQYEISNFSIEGYESTHNLKYWNCEEYLGIGPSAHSFINGKRFYYIRSLEDFICNPKEIEDGSGGDIDEYIMLKLRLSDGLKSYDFKKRFGINIPNKYVLRAKKYQGTGLIFLDSDGFRLTKNGFLLSNRIILDIIR